MELAEIAGHHLGERAVSYEAQDAILYALAVGARSDDLDLVYERDLRVLPGYALVLGLWVVEAAGGLGAYDHTRSLHAAQSLEMRRPLPRQGSLATRGRVAGVWDKGKAALVEIEVSSEVFRATYSIFLPGRGGWGGERGPSGAPEGEGQAPGSAWRGAFTTWPNQAAIYRLTGDRHPIHIDPEVAKANGFERPILHGLCTLGIAAREIAAAAGAHPAELGRLEARLSAPVMPGDTIEVTAVTRSDGVTFEAHVGDTAVLKAGRGSFGGF